MNKQTAIPVKRKTWLIHIVIILSFLLLAWAVWLFFELRIKEVAKKKEQLSREIMRKITSTPPKQQ